MEYCCQSDRGGHLFSVFQASVRDTVAMTGRADLAAVWFIRLNLAANRKHIASLTVFVARAA